MSQVSRTFSSDSEFESVRSENDEIIGDNFQSALSQVEQTNTPTPVATPKFVPAEPSEDEYIGPRSFDALTVWLVLLVIFTLMGFVGFVIGAIWMCATCPLFCVYIGTLTTARRASRHAAGRALSIWAMTCVLLSFLSFILGIVVCLTGKFSEIVHPVKTNPAAILESAGVGGTVAFAIFSFLLLIVIPGALACFLRSRPARDENNAHP
jgi:cytochrome bd-type quinol oxidase subunit 1